MMLNVFAFGLAERRCEIRHADVANDHQVDIAERAFFGPGHGAIHERAVDSRPECL
jgi:hypothetical protein